MAYIDNFDEETIIDVASQYGAFMNAKGGPTRYLPPLMDRSSNGGGIDKYENDFGRTDDEFNPNPPITPTSGRTRPWNRGLLPPDRTGENCNPPVPGCPGWKDRRRPDYGNAIGGNGDPLSPVPNFPVTDRANTQMRAPYKPIVPRPIDAPRTRPGWRPPILLPPKTRPHINPLPTDDLHRGRRRMYGTIDNPTAGDDLFRFTGADDYGNQVGAVKPTLVKPNFQSTMTNMGCNGLNSRRAVLSKKLEQFMARGIRPNQQMRLKDKITFIDNQIASRCSLPFSGDNGLWMNGDN